MSDSREAFEQLHAIPSGAIWCENRDVYIHKNYSGLVLHPINESWEAFCEGALWQASRQEGEPIGYVVPRMLKAMQAGKYCGISISDEKKDGDIAVYTHPASADEWIKCSEQTPNSGQRVILQSNGVIQNYMPLFDQGDSDFGMGDHFWDFEDINDIDNPLVDFENDSWMPRPEQLNQEQNQ